MDITLKDIRHTIEILLLELYPDVSELEKSNYSFDNILDQIIFELIKEDYKRNAEKHAVQYYLKQYDPDYCGNTRKYSRAIEYAQFYREHNNNRIESTLGFRLPELEAQDISGSKVFKGYSFTEKEFLEYKIQAECKLLNKFHGKQLDDSHKVNNSDFIKLFEKYGECIEKLQPYIYENPETIISRTLVYYGLETYFLTEALYQITLAAEEVGFPDKIPVERILDVYTPTVYIPENNWCPDVFFADLCIIPKWHKYAHDLFTADEIEWDTQKKLLWDCKRMKNIILQRRLDKWIEFTHNCTQQEKAEFICDHFWLWDSTSNFEWTSERIHYFRKLHNMVMRDLPKPIIK